MAALWLSDVFVVFFLQQEKWMTLLAFHSLKPLNCIFSASVLLWVMRFLHKHSIFCQSCNNLVTAHGRCLRLSFFLCPADWFTANRACSKKNVSLWTSKTTNVKCSWCNYSSSVLMKQISRIFGCCTLNKLNQWDQIWKVLSINSWKTVLNVVLHAKPTVQNQYLT